ncbi:glycine cleavage system protein H [Sulfolobus sp. E5-1-F]|uniref:glycine cleavage system protein H n=1 Tax=Sulfolobaceae TaxID=118883 RepID=UPI001296EEA5|nr:MULTISPECIES: glycine cleavage system protein H [unclassified Sulfolobus]QGA54233.1 glycine cleavage system protein H [Sulfolobus sp. E5-1-F]QGA69290.1 glycine cleavage system protein H [Sulfolobus sp. E11-6]
MKILGFTFPDDLLYEPEKHVWIRIEDNNVISIGVTDLGQYMAGKIFQVTVKQKGEKVNGRSILFSIESAKWIGKFRLPIEGEVFDVNENVVKNPSLINERPYDSWIIKIRIVDVDVVKRTFKPIQEVYKQFEEEAKRVVR